jgi:hypothetical protein
MIIRAVFSFILGVGTFGVLSITDEYLTTPGNHNTPLAAFLISALYLALAQFLLAPKGKGFDATKPTLVAMVAPVVLMFLLAGAIEKNANIADQTFGWFLICCGGMFGAIAASVCGKRVQRQEELIRIDLTRPE